MKRRLKANSIDGAIQAMQNVQEPSFKPPYPLSAKQRLIWDEILIRRSRDEWKTIDLWFAWQLADVLVRLKEEEECLVTEGMIIFGERGAKINPRHSVVQGLSKQSIALAIYLRVHPASEADYPTLVKGPRKAEEEARSIMQPPSQSDPRRNILPMMR